MEREALGVHIASNGCLAPRVFTKLLKPVLSELRSRGHQSVMYTDDCNVQAETFDMCLENINDTVNILENLGFVINRETSMMVPEKKNISWFYY